jgi:hypothetical protein
MIRLLVSLAIYAAVDFLIMAVLVFLASLF